MPPTYRYEVAGTGRAVCQNSACKKENVKILKGELRFGSLVTLPKFGDSWKWKHWGCVTPLQIANIIEQIGGLEDLDLDKDLDSILDGYDEIPDWAQNKIKDALTNGHVDDEDWKGDPELNRPGQKGINKRTPKKKAGDDDSADGAAEDSPVKPKKGSRKKKAAASDDEEDEQPVPKKKSASKKRKSFDDDEEEGVETAPPKKRAARSKKAAVQDEDVDAEDTKPVRKRAARSKKATTKDESADEAIPEPPKRQSRSRKVKQEPEAEAEAEAEVEVEVAEEPMIPQNDGTGDVEKKKTTKKAASKKGGKRAAPVDEDDDLQAENEAPAPKPAKASRSKRAKTEVNTGDFTPADPAPEPTKAGRKKVTKAPAKQDNVDEVLDAGDKKKQARRGRGKKANVIVPIPEDEQTDAAQPEEIDVPTTAADFGDVAEGETVEVEVEADEPVKKDKKKARMGRSQRRSSGKGEKA